MRDVRRFQLLLALSLLALLPLPPAAAGTLAVSSTAPLPNASNVARGTSIVVNFSMPVQTASVTTASLRVWGRSGGPAAGTVAWSNGNATLTFTPTRAFFPGEFVSVQLANTITASDGSPLRQAGYSFEFLTVAGQVVRNLVEIDEVSVRTGPGTTRLYGGSVVDLNRDGWIDYAGINEVSADLRILLNRADGSGLVQPVLVPPPPIGLQASPNEAGDYDNDGFIDIATSNTSDSTVSIVRGNGNGTFQPQQVRAVGNTPHGLAVLDVDGDADLDIVTANEIGNNLSLLINNGSGVFSAAAPFDSTGNGEYPLAAGDMNNDGIMDLVVGTRYDTQMHVLTGNGNGTFTHASNRDAGGSVWMIALGDFNGDRALDVASANGSSNNGTILLGNGNGTLQAFTASSFGGSMVGSDVGDLDGDGDLDWVTSSFGAGRWYVLTNNGAGVFSQVQSIVAPSNASCASLYDFDNDGDLDMALADEIADVVVLMRNGTPGVMFANGFEN